MTTSVSRWLHILCIMCNLMAFYIVLPVLCEGWHLPHMGKHFRDRIISQRRDVWDNQSSLTRPHFFLLKCLYKARTVSVMFLCGRGIDFAFFYVFEIWFLNYSYSVVFFVFQFILSYCVGFIHNILNEM